MCEVSGVFGVIFFVCGGGWCEVVGGGIFIWKIFDVDKFFFVSG